MLPTMAGFLDFLKGLKPKGKVAAAFGSYGWARGAVTSINGVLKEAGCEVFEPGLEIKYVPNEEDIKTCEKFAADVLNRITGK